MSERTVDDASNGSRHPYITLHIEEIFVADLLPLLALLQVRRHVAPLNHKVPQQLGNVHTSRALIQHGRIHVRDTHNDPTTVMQQLSGPRADISATLH